LEVSAPRMSWARWLILSEGQAEEGIEVTRIAADRGSVELLCQGTNRATVRLQTATNLPVPAVVLEDAGLNAVLDLFARFTNRTLLRWPALPAISFSLCASAKSQPSAARILEQALIAEDLAVIPDGEKFLMIVPRSEAANVNPHAPPAKASTGGGVKPQAAPAGTGAEAQEGMLPGVIDFRGADVWQVLEIYSDMVHRKFERGEHPNISATITLTTQGRLTMEEGCYALETVLRWSGMKLVPVGKDAIKPVPAGKN
jgi:hypothetical protein